jgi:hypothetical protein
MKRKCKSPVVILQEYVNKLRVETHFKLNLLTLTISDPKIDGKFQEQ